MIAAAAVAFLAVAEAFAPATPALVINTAIFGLGFESLEFWGWKHQCDFEFLNKAEWHIAYQLR
jgi:hypothetical protein